MASYLLDIDIYLVILDKKIETGMTTFLHLLITNHFPFSYFKTSPEVIRLAAILNVQYSLSLRNVEDLLHERGVDVSHETIRFWWKRFGLMFALIMQTYYAGHKEYGGLS